MKGLFTDSDTKYYLPHECHWKQYASKAWSITGALNFNLQCPKLGPRMWKNNVPEKKQFITTLADVRNFWQ